MRGGLRDETKAWPNLQRCERRRCAGSRQNESRGAGTRRRLNLPETVTDTDMFNLKGVTTMGRLADKNILITGGNSGIGLAAAQEFDREGARVAICGLNEGTLQATKETLGARSL